MKSRPQRWGEACALIRQGIEALEDLKSEYDEWQSNLPENLECSPTDDKLQAVADADLSNLETELDEIEFIDLPRGFGRD